MVHSRGCLELGDYASVRELIDEHLRRGRGRGGGLGWLHRAATGVRPEWGKAHRLYVEMGATLHAECVARKLGA